MAYSYVTYTGNGSTTQYAVSFPYIRREHVAVTVAGIPSTFTWVNNSLIQMDAAPANGAAVRVYRTTPISAPLVDFADGATLVAADLDTNSRQSIYIQQELDDAQVDNLPNVIPNGDKGDITTSVGGTVWAINNGAITNADVNASAGIVATKLSFTQTGTGATARTIDSKLKDVVSVKDFGAIGDGVASDTTAVQAAINAAAGLKAVFFPAGTYLCIINLPSNSTIYGEGQQTVLKLPNSSGRSLVQSSDTINGTDNCQVFSLQIDGNIANNNSTLCNGVFIDGACDNWIVQDLTIKNTGGNGIRVRGSGSTGLTTSAKRILIANNVLDNCGVKNSSTGADGIYLNGCQLAQVVNNRVDYAGRQAIALEGSVASAIATRQVVVSGNICTNATSGGIDVEANEGGDLIISGNIILDCPGVGVRAIGKTGNTVISGNLARNVGTGVDAENDQTIPSSLIISNNILRQIVGEGIKVNLASNANVIGNTIYDAGSNGIFITGDNSNNWKIANNIIDTTVGSGIYVNRSGTGFNIFNNSIFNAGTSGSAQPGLSVSIAGGGSLNYGNIADNHVKDDRTPAGTSYAYRFAGINYVAIKGNIAQGAATGDVQWGSVTPTNIQLRGNRWSRSTWSGAPTTYTFLEDDGIQLGGINSLPSVGLNTTGFSVGTLAPQGLFETAASGVTANAFLTGGAGNNAETAGLRFGSGSGRGARIAGFRGSSSNIHSLDFYSYNSADVFGMRLTSTGLGIGTIASPANQLQLSTDSAGKPSTALWTIVSDERIKEDIELADLDLCYEAVKAIPLKRYKWRDDIYTAEQVTDRRKLGWIAQDVEIVFPKAVGTHEFKYNQVFEETIIPAVEEELDADGNVITPAQPERVGQGDLISEDVIEDCRDLNSDQLYAAMYGAVQKLIAKVETLEASNVDMLARLSALEAA